GCWAHVRRRFFDALSTAPESREAMDLILELYRVEAQARGADVGIRPASDVTEPIAEGRGPCSAVVASLCESGLTGRT
ncbi:transposase, partial [Corallococcus carmarthensis]|nr:transposase [Corallococcus carmarthensis]